MGNTVYGQKPSVVFEIIRYNILTPRNELIFSTNKYDFQKEMRLLAEKEKIFYENAIEYQHMRLTNSENLDKQKLECLKSGKDFYQLLSQLELTDKLFSMDFDTDEIKITREVNQEESQEKESQTERWEFGLRVECDMALLDLTFGLLQLEMAEMLLEEISKENNDIDNIIEKNAIAFTTIKNKWRIMDSEEKSSRAMQSKAIEKSQACPEAVQNWWNWGII